jgi:cytoskeletal protein CcmA (bactofilin family)
MWGNKTPEAKRSSAASNTSGPASSAEKLKQTQAAPQQTSNAANPTSTPAAGDAATKSASGLAPAGAAASTAPAASKSAPVAAQAPVGSSHPPQFIRAGEASTISAGLKIKGDITGMSDLTIDGETQGKVRLTNGRVTVGPSGRVIADIDAREIVVKGTVQGNLKASDSVWLGASGHVEGSILTARIGIEDGARLRGNVEMIRPGEAQEPKNSERQEPSQAARAATATIGQE